MDKIHLFLGFIKDSYNEIIGNKSKYLPSFIALILLGNCESLFSLYGGVSDSYYNILIVGFVTLLTFVAISKVVLIQKEKFDSLSNGGIPLEKKIELKYFVPTFLLYNLYYSFLFLIGLIVLVLPGLYVLVFYSMAPLVAVLDDNQTKNCFKESKRLVQKNRGLIIIFSTSNLIVELLGLVLTPVNDAKMKGLMTLLFSVPDAFLTILMAILAVKIYYYLAFEGEK